jgi:hypothetical protein
LYTFSQCRGLPQSWHNPLLAGQMALHSLRHLFPHVKRMVSDIFFAAGFYTYDLVFYKQILWVGDVFSPSMVWFHLDQPWCFLRWQHVILQNMQYFYDIKYRISRNFSADLILALLVSVLR